MSESEVYIWSRSTVTKRAVGSDNKIDRNAWSLKRKKDDKEKKESDSSIVDDGDSGLVDRDDLPSSS